MRGTRSDFHLGGPIADFGPLIADGALDVVKIRAGSAESYHIELEPLDTFRFAVTASSRISIRVLRTAGTGERARRAALFADVDVFSFAMRSSSRTRFVIALENAGNKPVDVAVFFRTAPDSADTGNGKRASGTGDSARDRSIH